MLSCYKAWLSWGDAAPRREARPWSSWFLERMDDGCAAGRADKLEGSLLNCAIELTALGRWWNLPRETFAECRPDRSVEHAVACRTAIGITRCVAVRRR